MFFRNSKNKIFLQVDELWGLEPDISKPLGKIFGLIFLFKWDGKKETQSQGTVVNDQDQPGLFFARQVINNACGTQALLSVLLNIKDEKTELGETLANFMDFVGCLDSEMKGKLLYSRHKLTRDLQAIVCQTQTPYA